MTACDENARQELVKLLYEVRGGAVNMKMTDYVAKTFPAILIDLVRLFCEQSTQETREAAEPAIMIKCQLKPFFMFTSLLGKCPQITGLMYSYFENSSFQPLPDNLFTFDTEEKRVCYNYPGFSDELVIDILQSYIKYLIFNPKWFSAIWNWSELGKFITIHPKPDIRYLATCCLSIITKPSRLQHKSIMIDTVQDNQERIDLQIKYRHIYENIFKPCIETRQEKMANQYAQITGLSSSGYSYCPESIAKVANILLLKRDISLEGHYSKSRYENVIKNYIPVVTLNETVSRIAYSISINKPCLLRGPCGSGKTAVLDYVAAHTNRLNPPEYVKVQIGDQLDSKLLIGSYICTEIPGQFEWQPGPLTKAMAYGSWIVFEDIDLAPSDMAQVIHSVIENGNLSCVSCCPIKLDNPHPDFRIFFTQRSRQANSPNSLKLGFGFVERQCDIIEMPDLSNDDLEEVIETRYKFGKLTKVILQLYRKAQEAIKEVNLNRSVRSVSLRDLFKLCDRLSANKFQQVAGKYTAKDLESIYIDSIECFLSSLPRNELRKPAEELALVANLPANEVQRLIFLRKPDVREENGSLIVGRTILDRNSSVVSSALEPRSALAYTKQTIQLIESISVCIKQREAVLLVGETGVGKTSVIQHLAHMSRNQLVVINLSQQSDSSDLLGGFKPVQMRKVMDPINSEFEELFRSTFDARSNQTFLKHVNNCFFTAKKNSQWSTYLKLVGKLCGKAISKRDGNQISESQVNKWKKLHEKSRRLAKRVSAGRDSLMALEFTDGTLMRAVKEGNWILLDEINLAEPEVLQCLILILDSINKSYVYMHNPDESDGAIKIHPNFRLFACMNPSTDVGKRDLAIGTRSRFSEFFVDDVMDENDLTLIVASYVKTCLTTTQINNVVNFYLEVRDRSGILSDISGNSPVYSLRTLCRALSIFADNVCNNREKSLLESLKITFLQQLNSASTTRILKLIEQIIFNKVTVASLNETKIPRPKDNHDYYEIEGFWIQRSNEPQSKDSKYIETKTISKNLQSLARIISLSQRRLPILIQGNTSVGKTSLIKYLAKITGNTCYRINNHEHTDLQEYVGRYILKETGDLAFQEGLLVRAMRKGYWLILDELNLAPCELLEALNRVLDDNRELFIPETGETIKAHSKFMLFATQNPPEEYAGRKLLSRAFRNRFVELHFDEIPHDELETILHRRCDMPPNYAKKIVTVMRELQILRRESGCFNGKNGFMTLRDLFRWGERYAAFKVEVPNEGFFDWDTYVASEGLILLEGRVRTVSEADTVKRIIEDVFNRKLDREKVYDRNFVDTSTLPQQFKHIYFSKEFKKLFAQLSSALKYKEPVLLCGQTGCGKTTACQLYAALKGQSLDTYNCHLNSESADFVGGVRPSRDADWKESSRQMFPWVDGPLVQAMIEGHIFLMDEISLADDAVLERINSILEPNRSITLTEKDGEEIFARESFRIVATMNPGGDYGKKELSPALRNRFTEIYCHNTTDISEIKHIIGGCLSHAILKNKLGPNVLSVMHQFLKEYYEEHNFISVRDVLSWVQFINKTVRVAQPRPLTIQEAIINGASLVFFDQIGTCGHRSKATSSEESFKSKLKSHLMSSVWQKFSPVPLYVGEVPKILELVLDIVKFKKFCLTKGPLPILDSQKDFVLEAPTVSKNILKIVRAMQLDRPILLEGDPGAGKTSIITALAKLTGFKLVRINLSEQTDISDLFGSDLPDTDCSEDDNPRFRWHDGPMLTAIKNSEWVLLDEMNLASQSVLEGLNACFDHRGEIFISELNKTFKIDRSSTRIFACQNPYTQGSARKGLPQSFLNRFTSIYIESHSPQDLVLIVSRLYPSLPVDLIEKMVEFNSALCDSFQRSSHEFNLRDLSYWCDLLTRYVRGPDFKSLNLYKPEKFVQFVYLDRIRASVQRQEICDLFERIFGCPVFEPPYRDVKLGELSFMMARAILPRKSKPAPHLSELCILKYQMPFMESIAKAIEYNKMPIIVGESGAGKRSMVRILAGLTGNELNIIGANREMDTIELLGSYEQKSFQREVVDLVEEARCCVTALINSISYKQYASTWRPFFSHIWATLYATSIRDLKLSKSEMMDTYRLQLSQMKDLIEKIQPLSAHDTTRVCESLLEKINNLMRRSLYYSESMYSSGNFEWIDSILIKSIREGAWLMIENANLLNPATLDRLNSLVEPNGTLCLNEKGSGKDGIEVLTPHPDFRLILTMEPENGELSRAMRNRGVEIFVQTRFYFEDFLMLLNQNGFEPEHDKACMTYCIMQSSYDFHKKITGESPEEDGSILAYFGLNYLSTLTNQVRRGVIVDNILTELLIAFYSQRGFAQECSDEGIGEFVRQQMDKYRITYTVDLLDERYNWLHLRHDLVSLTGGDAVTGMIHREFEIFYDDSIATALKPDEMIDRMDIVNTCTTVKIFLDLSTHGDFEHRKGFIRDVFLRHPQIMKSVNKHVNLLHEEYIPLINKLLPTSHLTPVTELHVDSRHSPDIHYYLQSIDFQGTLKREGLQNRWLLSLHRIMLRMIIELMEESSPGDSLWSLAEQVRTGRRSKESLVRPVAEIAVDLCDLLEGLLGVISNRCFDDRMVGKMLPRLFWLSYFICKLRKGYPENEQIAVCNQIPMLWVLTYQKVIVPIIQDCRMYDLSYKNKKFSNRIQHICDFIDIPITKPCNLQKGYYKKVMNTFASTKRQCEFVSKEVDKFFATLVGRSCTRSQLPQLGSDDVETLVSSRRIWSNSPEMAPLYEIEDGLLMFDTASHNSEDWNTRNDKIVAENRQMIQQLCTTYSENEAAIKRECTRLECLNDNRRKSALDQFSPIWQFRLFRSRMAKVSSSLPDPDDYRNRLKQTLECINGIMMSPRYYSTMSKYLQRLHNRKESLEESTFIAETTEDLSMKNLREDVDMYTTFLTAHFIENIVLDHQVVNWTKMRVTTTDLPALAPLIPEYSPIVSLVGSYCLDIKHLKLNSYLNSAAQLNSMLLYLWRSYVTIKLDSDKDTQDIRLARNLIHLRSKLDDRDELIGSHKCGGPDTDDCGCVEEYIRRRKPNYDKIISFLESNLSTEDVETVLKSIKLIYFGELIFSEYAPMFTLDPSLRCREKLDVYTSELAHIKIDLHCRNTLFYWKTGENLLLNEIDSEGASCYPFPTRVLVERRLKLENSISKLRREHSVRPRSDDGMLYFELRKDVEVNMNRYKSSIELLEKDLIAYSKSDAKAKPTRFNNLISKCRMLIKNLQRSISKFQNDYSLYSDLITNYQAGMCFVVQGLRCLYSRLEQKLQIMEYGFSSSIKEYYSDISRVFSFLNFTQDNIESVHRKLEFFPRLEKVCPTDRGSNMQSLLLHSVLNQLNLHIVITPSDINKCIPIVYRIADLFQAAWLKRKLYLEGERKKREDLYQYKSSTTSIGINDLTREEFIDLCSKFPTYDHVYQEYNTSQPPTSSYQENLQTEEKVINLNRSVDLSMCIDICKAHYKFFKEASLNLLGQVDSSGPEKLPEIDLGQMVKLEAEMFYTVIRHCIPTLDRSYDAQTVECHLLQAYQLYKALNNVPAGQSQVGTLKSSIEILDEDIFDIYHDAYVGEALKFQELITNIDRRVSALRKDPSGKYENHSTLNDTVKLTTRINSFLISDPLIKFVTGSHVLLGYIEQWNGQSIPDEDKLLIENDSLIELIKSWRTIEFQSWRSSLHRVKKRHIDGTLCDLWFKLYEAFNNPIELVQNYARRQDPQFTIAELECEDDFYICFAVFIRDFLEESTLGDYQIRLDLVFSFVIQTRFAGLYEQARPNYGRALVYGCNSWKVDYDKLTSHVYNLHRQYQGLLESARVELEAREHELGEQLEKELTIVSWQSRNSWEIKINLRKAHRKINKVMNSYLEVLRRIVPTRRPLKNISTNVEIFRNPGQETQSEQISATLVGIRELIESVNPPPDKSIDMSSLKRAPQIVSKLKQTYNTFYEPMTSRFVHNLVTIEDSLSRNADSVRNFHHHKVEEVVIDSEDSKEIKANKHKLCRQMYNSKKFAMQSVFKDLQLLGVSYQRGLNSEDLLDSQVISLEPLRGMIQNQSRLVLKAASRLVDDKIIMNCNEQYEKLIASQMILLSQNELSQDLTSDQINRIRGCALDMVLGITKQNRSASYIYKHLMDIQAATTRLMEMQKISDNDIIIYNFSKIQRTIQQFNKLVGRAYLFIAKLEEISNCSKVLSGFDVADNESEIAEARTAKSESDLLRQLFNEVDENNSVMTAQQLNFMRRHLLDVRKTIAEVSSNLRDLLNCTVRNYMYSGDDKDNLNRLYAQFYQAMKRLVPEDNAANGNLQQGTLLGSIRILLDEAENKLKPSLEMAFAKGDSEQAINMADHPNLEHLNIRLRKLVRQVMLAVQGICQEESNHQEQDDNRQKILSIDGSTRRNMKPINYIDGDAIKNLLRINQVATCTEKCFKTLNFEQNSANIRPIIDGLTPILYIYTQDVACYLNIILTSLHLKLNLANQLIPFFTDLVMRGFGLPNKLTNDSNGTETSKGKSSEDNVGFGEGQGEKDVTNKLEFESQLDDLKTNEDNSEKKDEDEPVKAHDDGVEMSEDIDAKATGPDEAGDQNGLDHDEEEDEDDQDLDELDKELDRVDNDEGKLDEKIWDDQDDKIEEDDEEDLRETELDASGTSKNETDMKAKTEDLSESKKDKAPESDENTAVGENDSADKMDASDIEEKMEEGDDPDLDAEADQALDRKLDEDTASSTKQEVEEDLIDLTGSDNEQEQMEQDADDDNAKDAQNTANKSDGELSEDENEDGEARSAASSQNVTINDDDIDYQLEVALRGSSFDEEIANPIEETIRNITAEAQENGGQGKPEQKMAGRTIGQHTVYDIMEEEDDDPIDCGDDTNEQQQEDRQEKGQHEANSAGLGVPEALDTMDKENMETEEVPSKEADPQKQMGGDEKNSAKRTLADQSDNDTNAAKRQRILDAAEDDGSEDEVVSSTEKSTEEREDDAKEKESQKNSLGQYRHVATDTGKTIEVIDLISDSEDGENTSPEISSLLDDAILKPKEGNNDPASIPKKDEESSYESVADCPADIKDEFKEAPPAEEKSSSDAAMYSPVSSIESGELDLNSDVENQVEKPTERNLNTSYNTNIGLLKYISLQTPASKETDLIERIDNELNRKCNSEYDSVDAYRLQSLWLECTNKTGHLVQELCQQLQIVLQPTKMTKYKGDYKSGKRLNMRKIISYIASHYRRDKIWLRRTKPSKRTYNISLAVDNSSSMSENNCRQMTYQSLALLANALSLIEAGSLNVVSFGERVNCIHEFGQPYVDAQGAQWLRDLRFNESRTSYKSLLEHSCKSFTEQARLSQFGFHQPKGPVSQLLVIISDGRNVTSEEEEVKSYLKQLKSMGVLTLFVIIDDLNRNGGKSIVDVKRCVGFGANIQMLSYMELFPFPFYVILRQLDSMPSVLGDALRQWFELVSNGI